MKNVLITGVSGGLGKALAELYLIAGYRVYGYDQKEEEIQILCTKYPEQFYFQQLDIRDEKAIASAIEQLNRQGICALDILINCAGILPENSEKVLEEFQIDEALDVYNVNALGTLRMTKAALPMLKQGKEKIIITISSEAGSVAAHADYINRYDYCMSKAALNIQSVILQRYVKEDGIKVFLFNPGWMRTKMGGMDAPLLPEKSAYSMKEYVEKYQNNHQKVQLIDYNGSIRPW